MNTYQISQSARSKHVEQADSKQSDNRYEARYKTRDWCPQTNQINHISAYPSSRFPSFHALFSTFLPVQWPEIHHIRAKKPKERALMNRDGMIIQSNLQFYRNLLFLFVFLASLPLYSLFFLRVNASSSSEDRKGRFTPAN